MGARVLCMIINVHFPFLILHVCFFFPKLGFKNVLISFTDMTFADIFWNFSLSLYKKYIICYTPHRFSLFSMIIIIAPVNAVTHDK